MNIAMKMSSKDEKFFDENWQQWVDKNPPPEKWIGTKKEWAEFEMPCIGFLGRALFWFSMPPSCK